MYKEIFGKPDLLASSQGDTDAVIPCSFVFDLKKKNKGKTWSLACTFSKKLVVLDGGLSNHFYFILFFGLNWTMLDQQRSQNLAKEKMARGEGSPQTSMSSVSSMVSSRFHSYIWDYYENRFSKWFQQLKGLLYFCCVMAVKIALNKFKDITNLPTFHQI